MYIYIYIYVSPFPTVRNIFTVLFTPDLDPLWARAPSGRGACDSPGGSGITLTQIDTNYWHILIFKQGTIWISQYQQIIDTDY